MRTAIKKRIEKKAKMNEVAVVVPRRGEPSRVFSIEAYLKMKELPAKHSPWRARGMSAGSRHVLPQIPGGRIVGSLSRKAIYGRE